MTTRQYTKSEVASSNSKEKTLIILHDKVYDVSSFLNEHPGGEEILVDHGGRDSSEDFDDVGHSKDAMELMKKYQVGELVESERMNRPPKQWSTSYSKAVDTKKEEGMSPVIVVTLLVILLAYFIAYFVYL